MQTIIDSIKSVRRSLAPLTGAERRTAAALIAVIAEQLAPLLLGLARPIWLYHENYEDGGNSEQRGILLWRSSTLRSGDWSGPYAADFCEVWLTSDGYVWVDGEDHDYGLVHKGECQGYQNRTARRCGAREIARRVGGREFARSVEENLRRELQRFASRADSLEGDIAAMRRIMSALGA